jgi:hypothetical protein
MQNVLHSVKRTHYILSPLNAELNPIRHLLAVAGAHHFVDASSIRVKVSIFVVLAEALF